MSVALTHNLMKHRLSVYCLNRNMRMVMVMGVYYCWVLQLQKQEKLALIQWRSEWPDEILTTDASEKAALEHAPKKDICCYI